MSANKVTVIGLGPMGEAMVNAYLDNGYLVTVWNRTRARADAVAARGAIVAPTVEAALSAGELIVLSLTDYAAADAILAQAPPSAVEGKVVVNLSSDTPGTVRAAAARLAAHGAVQLTGGVQVPPPGIGTPGASTYYSGPEDVVEKHRATLEVLTGIDYLGEDPGLAALFYQIGMDMFWTGLLSYLHAQAVAEANGISAQRLLPIALKTMDFGYFLEFYAPRISEGNHEGDVDKISMGEASIRHVIDTVEESGVDSSLPAAVHGIFARGMEAGLGADSLTSLLKVLRRQ
ncbi:6-phosphogluconate dehydrogenase [Prauserella marina]|uniref:3-hydroxyisobutyrate dehydrogenase n=1 Tax=Prauserella marina TaxID=530584 RepID=A0A222VSQ5_9PSEU|nr:NAD(P)-binding domain-containing protein [Prauserella marina]ASR36938.1 6-phosphogluconate dehydrogenase [Prauserella marina]PWV80109.1 3-hydroxyisobutyrate dehydrogenase-like beta-hydroxyacid dehydrogenase [Prauserella marina]SDD83025.1 3-hydroxyisobutyrate dehydrogenase [Prauserella marina]